MKKSYIITIIVAVLIIVAAITYVFFSPNNALMPSKQSTKSDASTEKNSETKTKGDDETVRLAKGAYIDYAEEKIATTKGTKVLFFHASWCPQCQALEKDLKASKIPDGVTIFKVDYDANQPLRQKYGVTLQTTFVKIDDDGNRVDSYVAYDKPTFASVKKNLLDE